MKRIDVRCCCTPGKVLGSLPVRDDTSAGEVVRFVVMKPRTRAAPARTTALIVSISEVCLTAETFADLSGAHPKYGIALKADGVELETLRRIPGFIEEKRDAQNNS